MKKRCVAIIGNPNCGKTTLFNALTGSNQKIGNWSGVTVDKKIGHLSYEGEDFSIVDLPGIYSLSTSDNSATDEKIACDFMLSSEVDLVVNIVDAANLKRNLYLSLQLKEMEVPCILVINMMDIAAQRGLTIHLETLSKMLNCPIIPMILSKNQGLSDLKYAIKNSLLNPSTLQYSPALEDKIKKLQTSLPPEIEKKRFYAIHLLEKDVYFMQKFHDKTLLLEAENCRKELENEYAVDADIVLADARYKKIQEIISGSLEQKNPNKKNLTEKADRFLMHPWLGIPIFLFIMYLMFEFSMNIGTLLQPLFNITSTAIFVDGANYYGSLWHLPLWLIAIISNGIGLGVNTVVNFIPQIGLMFLFLSLLEDSGYMARAAFVMDRFMQYAGLPGKSFVPLIVGFGCNVPSIMAARTLDTRRDRVLTSMMAPFMSCGARLAIFVVIASAFFPHSGGEIIFILYVIGILAAILTGLILKKTLLLGGSSPFIMELPPYHAPLLSNIFRLTWHRLKRFIFRAGKMIIPICIVVGSLNAITPEAKVYPYGSEDSILSITGRALTPLLAPMGIHENNWPATVGLITGTLAKEVVVGTLNTLYSQQKKPPVMSSFNLLGELKSALSTTVDGFSRVFSTSMMNPFTANEAEHEMTSSSMGHMVTAFASPVAAFAYLLFVLLYIPCISTMSVLAREIGTTWAISSIVWSFNIAYVTAVLFYQAATFLHHPLSSAIWILSLILWQSIIFLVLRFYFAPIEVQDVAY